MKNSLFIPLVSIGVCGLAATLSYFLTFLFIQLSRQFDLLDYPAGRKNHKKPTPFLGGLSIFISFWVVVFGGLVAASFVSTTVTHQILKFSPKLAGIFAGSAIILIVGLLDDKFRWSPLRKLAGQVLAAGILMSLGLTINLIESLGFLGYVGTFLWIILIINAFNFIDSLDGHCTGIALISSIMFFWMTQIMEQQMLALFLITFSGALIGFLPHNFKPAKIFLGDNGSHFIGYMMAAFTLLCRYQAPHSSFAVLFIPVLIFGVPIYDMMSVIIVRLSRGMAPWQGDRNHFAHRLVKIGMSEKVAVIFSYLVAFTIGHVAVLTTQVDLFGVILIGIIFLSIIGVIAFLEFYAAQRIRISDELAKRLHRRREDIQRRES